MNLVLLITALVILLCVWLNILSGKLGVPVLPAFILLGMAFGSDGIVKIDFYNFAAAERIRMAALIFIMFYGGFGTNWKEAKKVAVQAGLLSSLGVVLTAGFVGLFAHFLCKFSLFNSFLIGSVIASTDAATSMLGGNGYLSVYITGIIIGNTDILGKKELVPFFDGITGLMQIVIFFPFGTPCISFKASSDSSDCLNFGGLYHTYCQTVYGVTAAAAV